MKERAIQLRKEKAKKFDLQKRLLKKAEISAVDRACAGWIMDAVEGSLACTKSVKLLEEPGVSMELEVCAGSGGVKTGRTFSSMSKVFNWELKLDIPSVEQALEEQKSEQQRICKEEEE